jgi:hypothetical protein
MTGGPRQARRRGQDADRNEDLRAICRSVGAFREAQGQLPDGSRVTGRSAERGLLAARARTATLRDRPRQKVIVPPDADPPLQGARRMEPRPGGAASLLAFASPEHRFERVLVEEVAVDAAEFVRGVVGLPIHTPVFRDVSPPFSGVARASKVSQNSFAP